MKKIIHCGTKIGEFNFNFGHIHIGLSWTVFGKTIFKFNLSKMQASNWRSDIFRIIELGLDSSFSHYSTTKKPFGFFGLVKIPAQNRLSVKVTKFC